MQAPSSLTDIVHFGIFQLGCWLEQQIWCRLTDERYQAELDYDTKWGPAPIADTTAAEGRVTDQKRTIANYRALMSEQVLSLGTPFNKLVSTRQKSLKHWRCVRFVVAQH